MKILYISIAVFFLSVLRVSPVNSEETSNKNVFHFYWSPGTKFVYSSGMSDTYTYNRSNITGGFKTDYLDISAYISRYFHYQTTDGNGNYEYRSFNEAGISLAVQPLNIINLSGEYSRSDDFNDLNKNYYYGNLELDFTRVTLSADYSYEDFKYNIDLNTIDTTKRDYSYTFDFEATEAISADISYAHSNIYFNSLGYDYYKNILRIGLMIIPADYLFLMAGASGGKDSEDYTIYGADCGATFIFYSRFKLSLIYNFAYYFPGLTESSGGSGNGQNQSSGGKSNPYLSSDKAGESYYSHSVSLGVSMLF